MKCYGSGWGPGHTAGRLPGSCGYCATHAQGSADTVARICEWLRTPNDAGAFYGSIGAKSLADAIEREFGSKT